MKKLLSFIAIAVLGISTTFAQTAATVPASKKTAKKVSTVKAAPAEVKKVETKVSAVKTTAPSVTKKSTSTAVVKGAKLKADGTPDMRYADNKAKKAVAGPAKKDGTADMRYKANKTVGKKN